MNGDEERSCLFSINEQSGNRQPVEKIGRKSIIGFMDATPWCGESRANRRSNAIERINSFVGAVYNNEEPHNLQICSYASPERIDVENRWVRISGGGNLSGYQKQFVEKYLVPLISEDASVVKQSNIGQAKQNMRLTLVGFSYGGMFISGIRKHLIEAMKNLDYTPSEISDVFSQVLQINFGVQHSEEDKLEPKFNQVSLVTRTDNQGIWESWAMERKGNFILLDSPDSVTREDGKVLTKPHSQEMYMQGLQRKPDLCQEITKNIAADTVKPISFKNNLGEMQYIQERLAEISYRLQMQRRH
jgi:hypothetical protein